MVKKTLLANITVHLYTVSPTQPVATPLSPANTVNAIVAGPLQRLHQNLHKRF